MTVENLYQITKDVMYEKASSNIYDDKLINNLNILLVELFDENNMSRMFKDMKPLTEVPLVSSTSDELIYETEYLYEVLPFGLANRFEIDDDLNKHSIYEVYYNNARVKNQRMISKDRIDALSK